MSDSYTIELTEDLDILWHFLSQPGFLDSAADDHTATMLRAAGKISKISPSATLLLSRRGETPVAIWAFTERNQICAEGHVVMLPAVRHADRDLIFRMMLDWVWFHTPCERLICEIPAYNWLAVQRVKRQGFTEFGRNPNAWLKHGKRWDLVCLGISKP